MEKANVPKKTLSNNNSPSLKRKILYIFGVFITAFFLMEALILGSGLMGNALLNILNPDTSSFINQYELAHGKMVRLQWLPLKQVSRNMIRGVIVAEDDAFFDHEGLDLKEMKASWHLNWKKKKIVRGGSTITMQLVKNLYLSNKKNPLRKINEILLALDMENKVSKVRILEVYLNIAEWGRGIYGVEAASKHYFGISAKSLSPGQAAYLAALLPNPTYLSGKGSHRASMRKSIILRRMAKRPLPKEL